MLQCGGKLSLTEYDQIGRKDYAKEEAYYVFPCGNMDSLYVDTWSRQSKDDSEEWRTSHAGVVLAR